MSAAVNSEDRYFTSNGVKIRYLVRGQGEPVVLIHGFSVRIETNWELPGPTGPGRRSALAHDYQVIAFLRGRLPHLQVVEIEGAAHIGTLHHPGAVTRPEFLQRLQAFLRAHPI